MMRSCCAVFCALLAAAGIAIAVWPAPVRLADTCSGKPISGTVRNPTGREFDVVVHGSTGFTGELTVLYLATHEREPNYAIAGRSQAKLDSLVRKIQDAVAKAGKGKLPAATIIADSGDADQLLSMAKRAKVVLAAAGPYAKYGDLLVDACAAAGTHYADLSGEALWERRVIDRLHGHAAETGAKLVHSAGYDSVPFDLGVQIALREMDRIGAKSPLSVTAAVTKMGGGVSGGTLDAVFGMVGELRSGNETIQAWNDDPYLLVPDTSCRVDSQVTGWGPMPRYDQKLGAFAVPHFMAPINARTVRRSLHLLGKPGVGYSEGMTFGGIADAIVRSFPFVLNGEMKLMPSPGEGPSLAMQMEGSYEAVFVGSGQNAEVRITAQGNGDPGYRHTSKLFAEVALCLADVSCLRSDVGGGVLTPLAALDRDEFERRLRAASHEDGSPLLTYTVTSTHKGDKTEL